MPSIASPALSARGVYRITHLASGKSYIGSTATSFNRRWNQHRRLLNTGRHHNALLQHAWSKYGPDAFEWAVLEVVANPRRILEREQYWIEHSRKQFWGIYNIADIAGAPMSGRKHSLETRAKLGRPYPALIHSETGEIIPAGHNFNALCTSRGLEQSNMSGLFCGRVRVSQGWMLLDEAQRRPLPSDNYRAEGRPYPAFRHVSTGEVIPAGKNLRALCRIYGLDDRQMWSVADGKKYTYKGWALADGGRSSRQFIGKSHPALVNTQTKERIPAGMNISILCRQRGWDVSGVRKLIRGIHKQYKGWIVYPGDIAG